MCLQLVAKLTLPSNQNQNLLNQVIKKRYFISVFENFTANLQNRRGHCHMDIRIWIDFPMRHLFQYAKNVSIWSLFDF